MPPSINNDYMKCRGIMKYKGGKPFAMAMMYETAEAKKFKKNMVKLIKEEIIKQEFETREDYSFVNIYWTWFFPSVKNDTNNRLKCAIDAITMFGDEFEDLKIWTDDNVSMNKDVKIYYDSINPRVELEIRYAPDVGIFTDKEEHDSFVNTYCNKCKKGNKIGLKGGCLVYRNAMESRIKERDTDGYRRRKT